jgi:hypothetical protein
VDNKIDYVGDESWAFFLNMTSSVPLKSYLDDPEVNLEAQAVKIIAVDLSDALFVVPGGVRAKLEE